MTEALDRLPRGATSISDLSSHVEDAVERGWVYGTLMFGDAQVRTGYLIVVGMLKTPSLRNALLAISREFEKIKVDDLADEFDKIVAGSPEASAAQDGSTARRRGARRGQRRDGAGGDGQAGGAEAVLGRPDRAGAQRARSIRSSGRDEEIRQIVDILMRRRQNNPILTGEAGVGKTAVVEGLRAAHRARRRAAAAEGRQPAARSTSACCRPAPA